jgi:Icc-related predicted phosphoesterase
MGLFRRNRDGNGEKRFTRIFFATDLHGSDDCFRKLISAATVYKVDALVVGGDITGKQLVPIVRQADGSYTCTFLGREQRLASEEELQRQVKLITRAGNYSYVTDAEDVAALSAAPERVDELMHRLVAERVAAWVELADEKLAGTGVPLYMCGGNDDFFEIDEILDRGECVVNHNGRVVQVDESHEMMALGYANPTPWHCPRDISEEELGERLEALAGQVRDVERAIFCLHVPPIDSTLDTCPRLDDSVYPPRVVSDGAGAPLMYGAGSTAVRAGIERHQPLLSLHGHIHESRGVTQIGRTLAINPGSEYGEGILRAALVNLTPDGILSHQLIAG